MKKVKVLTVILLSIFTLSSCGIFRQIPDEPMIDTPEYTEPTSNDVLANTEWVADYGEIFKFKEDGKLECDYEGSYRLYKDSSTVSDYEQKYNECQENLKKTFEAESEDIPDGTPIVLIIDLEGNSSDNETGMQTHFDYYGLMSDSKIVICEPHPHNYDSVITLTRKQEKER